MKYLKSYQQINKSEIEIISENNIVGKDGYELINRNGVISLLCGDTMVSTNDDSKFREYKQINWEKFNEYEISKLKLFNLKIDNLDGCIVISSDRDLPRTPKNAYQYPLHSLKIWKLKDEWYCVNIDRGKEYYKCDQFDGLINLLNKLEIDFNNTQINETLKIISENNGYELINRDDITFALNGSLSATYQPGQHTPDSEVSKYQQMNWEKFSEYEISKLKLNFNFKIDTQDWQHPATRMCVAISPLYKIWKLKDEWYYVNDLLVYSSTAYNGISGSKYYKCDQFDGLIGLLNKLNNLRNVNLRGETFLAETLKSDEIEIVSKKLDNFFKNLEFNKKYKFGEEVISPYYQIVSDRDYMKRTIEEYKNPPKYLLAGIRKLNRGKSKEEKIKLSDWLEKEENYLEDFKYGDIFIAFDSNTPEITKNLLHLIDAIGYFVSSVGQDKIEKSEIQNYLSNKDQLFISIEPKYDSQVNFEGEYLYHTTDKRNLDKVMKIGLIPKSKNTRSFYPERIYLSPNIKWMKSIRDQLSTDKIGEYVDLRINNFDGLKLYKDVRFKGGFFTYTNIPPKYIEIL